MTGMHLTADRMIGDVTGAMLPIGSRVAVTTGEIMAVTGRPWTGVAVEGIGITVRTVDRTIRLHVAANAEGLIGREIEFNDWMLLRIGNETGLRSLDGKLIRGTWPCSDPC